MILLAGDLFHDNKPSRKAMYQVMRSLRMNCLGDKPCELEMLSDASDVFEGAFNHVNYEDPDINVAIPCFSIHGNHDDPTGDGHFCSLDLLQVSGLLNYFGRTPESDNIAVKPILLQKGQTKLALYGMSNVRDERLFRTFRDGNVRFYKPGQQQSDWFNLMAVHQNHHAHTATGYLPENFLPEFLDLVVWGHEHECIIDPRYNPETSFHVMQPGSSVATSLVAGEAVPKHVAIVSVTGKEFKVEKHRIRSVRPFLVKEIALSSDRRFRGLEKKKENKQDITYKLMEIVEEMIDEAKQEWMEVQDEDERSQDVPLPLIRLRVEYSAHDGGKFDIENPQRFSNRFVGKVANTNDVVQFYRKKTGGSTGNKAGKEAAVPDPSVMASMTMDTIKLDKLVNEYFTAQPLKILPQAPFVDAVTQFVDKDDKHAVEACVVDSLTIQVKQLMELEDDDDDLDPIMERIREEQEQGFLNGTRKRSRKGYKFKPRPDHWDSDLDGEWEDQPGAIIVSENEEGAHRDAEEDGTPVVPARRSRMFISDDEESVMGPPPKKAVTKRAAPAKKAPAKAAPAKAPAKRAPAKAATTTARGKKKATQEPSDDEDEDVIMIDDDFAPPPKVQPKRAAATRGAASTARQSTLNFSQSQPRTQVSQSHSRTQATQRKELSDDEISDDDDAFETLPSSKPTRRR